MARKLVIFADGTGNAFTTQESNVWRLFQALDQSRPDQIARYIRGVGTSGFKPLALLDGATGIGVPSNVRELYRFLCWNWAPGDEIYLFGFSRGAFTIRTLIGLIASQGLMPCEIDGVTVSHEEMDRNAMAAWRRYRARNYPRVAVRLPRLVRDGILALWHRAWGHRPYTMVQQAMSAERQAVPIQFAGLFDTVEAYGVPIEELRVAIDKVIWPMSFSNFKASASVRTIRHALALDDERTTFHPLRFDMSEETTDRIKEVWFSGVHSDIGGGYPDAALAYVPLAWMASEAEGAGEAGLRFVPGAIAGFHAKASAYGPRHDSRGGAAVLYRYAPRPIERNARAGGPPVIHHAVAERIAFGSDNYAPVTLREDAQVLLPGDGPVPIALEARAPDSQPKLRVADEIRSQRATVQLARRRLQLPDAGIMDLAQDLVWWRRVAWFGLLLSLLLIASLPLSADALSDAAAWLGAKAAGLLGFDPAWLLAWASQTSGGFGANLDQLAEGLGVFIPAYLASVVAVMGDHPYVTLAAIVPAWLCHWAGMRLRDRIAEHARSAWLPQRREAARQRGSTAGGQQPSRWLRIARTMRLSRPLGQVHRLVSRYILPTLALILLGLALLVAVSRMTVTYRTGAGTLCPAVSGPPQLVAEGPAFLREGFDTSNPCWASGLQLLRGHRYTLWIEMQTPYVDGDNPDSIQPGLDGFGKGHWPHIIGRALRRWWAVDWFRPVARVGREGGVEWPLHAVDGGDDDMAPNQAVGQPANRRFVAEFVAPVTGEFFLYVNDAIAALPFLPTCRFFYNNNHGTARVTLQRTPVPLPQTAP